MAIYKREFYIGVTDIGKDRKITNRAILRIFQDIAGMQSEEAQFGINQIEETKLSWIILNWKLEVIKRPIYNSKVIVKTWIRNSNKVFLYRDFEMYDENEKKIAKCTSKWAFLNIDTKELTQISKKVIDSYGEESKMAFDQKEIPKLKEQSNYSNKVNYSILKRDIDINNHVHNLNYLDIAYEAMSNIKKTYKEYNNLEILFKKQIKLDDKIIVLCEEKKDESQIAIKSEDEKILHALIKLY